MPRPEQERCTEAKKQIYGEGMEPEDIEKPVLASRWIRVECGGAL
jgi:hypothetical protein